MRVPHCEQCNHLWSQFEAAIQEYASAESEFEIASRDFTDGRLATSKERLHRAEQARVRSRQDILVHEKASHPDQTASFA